MSTVKEIKDKLYLEKKSEVQSYVDIEIKNSILEGEKIITLDYIRKDKIYKECLLRYLKDNSIPYKIYKNYLYVYIGDNISEFNTLVEQEYKKGLLIFAVGAFFTILLTLIVIIFLVKDFSNLSEEVKPTETLVNLLDS